MKKTILITGGTGYIGSHIAVELLKNDYEIIILDNLANSHLKVLDRIEALTGKRPKFYKIDLRDEKRLKNVFDENTIDVVIHLAGLKSIPESIKKPLEYYHNNVIGTLNLVRAMREYKVNQLLFSSSASVVEEEYPVHNDEISPYSRSKWFVEEMLEQINETDSDFTISILRYYNPIGAHESGILGEESRKPGESLMNRILAVCEGSESFVPIYGDSYETRDGTAVRDYIHIQDLAQGHTVLIDNIDMLKGINRFYFGSGEGVTVLELIKTFERATGQTLNYRIFPPRRGDLPVSIAQPDPFLTRLGWKPERNLSQMCKDAFIWHFRK